MGMVSWIFTVHETVDRRVLILFFHALQLNCEHTKHHIRICAFFYFIKDTVDKVLVF